MIRPSLRGLGLASTLVFFAPSAIGAPQKHVEYHPKDAVWFVCSPDLPGLTKAYPGTSFGRLLQDEGLNSLIGGLAGTEISHPLDLAQAAYDEAVLKGDLPPFLPLLKQAQCLSASIVFNGEGPVEGLIAAASGPGEGEKPEPPMLQVMLEFSNDTAASESFEMVLAMGEAEAAPFTVEVRQGSRVAMPPSSAEDSSVVILDGPSLAILVGRTAPEELLKRLHGEAPGLDPQSLGAGTETLDAQGTVVLEWLSQAAFANGSEHLDAQEVSWAEMIGSMAEALFGTNFSMLLRGGHWRVVIDEEGAFITEGVFDQPDSVGSRILSSKPLQGNALGLLPSDAMVRWCSSLDKAALIDFSKGLLTAHGDGAEPRFDFETELFGALGDSVAVGLPAPKSLLAAPPAIGVVTLSDAEGFERGLDRLIALAEEGGLEGVRIEKDEYRSTPIYNFQAILPPLEGLPIPVDLGGFIRPSLAVHKDRLIITTLSNHTKRELRRVLKEDGEGTTSVELKGVPAGVTQIVQADWAKFIGSVYGGLKALASLMGSGIGDIPVDPSALPEEDHIVSFFKPSLSWMAVADGRGRAFQRSSFGPETILGAILPPLMLVSVPVHVSELHGPEEAIEMHIEVLDGAVDDGAPLRR